MLSHFMRMDDRLGYRDPSALVAADEKLFLADSDDALSLLLQLTELMCFILTIKPLFAVSFSPRHHISSLNIFPRSTYRQASQGCESEIAL
jgi:hypothetical protein